MCLLLLVGLWPWPYGHPYYIRVESCIYIDTYIHPQGAHLIGLLSGVQQKLAGNPKLVWHPACIIKEGECMNLSMDDMHLKDPLVLFGA